MISEENIIDDCACGGLGHLIKNEVGFYVRCENAPHWHTPPIHSTERKAIRFWNEMQASLDDLARDAIIAAHRGISYGEYMSSKGKRTQPAVTETMPQSNENRKRCAICGEEIPKGTLRIKYCSGNCADIAFSRQREAYKKKTKK